MLNIVIARSALDSLVSCVVIANVGYSNCKVSTLWSRFLCCDCQMLNIVIARSALYGLVSCSVIAKCFLLY